MGESLREQLQSVEARKTLLEKQLREESLARTDEAMQKIVAFVQLAIGCDLFTLDPELHREIVAAGIQLAVSFNHQEHEWVPDGSGEHDALGRPRMISRYWRSPVHVTITAVRGFASKRRRDPWLLGQPPTTHRSFWGKCGATVAPHHHVR